MKKLLYLLAAAVVLAPVGTAWADDNDPEQNPARQSAVAWIKTNNENGIDASIVRDMTEVINQAVVARENIALSFGERLLSGGSPVQIVSWDGQFLVIPLTVEQARQMELKPTSVVVTNDKRRSKREPVPVANLQDVKFDNASSIDGSKAFAGAPHLPDHRYDACRRGSAGVVFQRRFHHFHVRLPRRPQGKRPGDGEVLGGAGQFPLG